MTPLSTSMARPRPRPHPTTISALVPAPVTPSAPTENEDAPVSPSALTENEDASSTQANATNVSANAGTSQDASSTLLVVPNVIPALESSAGPSNSPPDTSYHTAGHKNTTNVLPASGTSKDPAPPKRSRKPAAKKVSKPKPMADSQ